MRAHTHVDVMTRRRPGQSPVMPDDTPSSVSDVATSQREGSAAIWYVLLIGAVLVIAVALYAVYLHQQAETWKQAANQLSLGQELLRADRDDILRKAREREAALATIEVAREQDRARLDGLEGQRQRLQDDVLRLTEELARSDQRADRAEVDAGQVADRERLQRERDRLDRELAARQADMQRMETTLAEVQSSLEENQSAFEALRAEKFDIEQAKSTLEEARARAEQQLAENARQERLRQIVRGHRASFGDVKPYIAEVGPGGWSEIESWLALQLSRPMAVPELSTHGWSYEGARLLGADDGPPMVMLLYADAEDRPASLTIMPDRNGEQPLTASRNGELNLMSWREEHHAFILAGQAAQRALEAVGLDLINQPPGLRADAPVPISRYIRPSFRPADGS